MNNYNDMLPPENEKIPLLKKWNHWYILVIVFLVFLIVFFYLFTKHFA